jgi:hypothetical protein
MIATNAPSPKWPKKKKKKKGLMTMSALWRIEIKKELGKWTKLEFSNWVLLMLQ